MKAEKEVNPSTPRHECRGLLRVDPERRFPSSPSKAGLSAVERVNFFDLIRVSFRVPSIDDLIRLKKIRPPNVKDEQDIEYLLKAKQLFKLKKL